MNKEQLEFFYNEIMGMFGWDDEDTASGVDPLLWAKAEIGRTLEIVKEQRKRIMEFQVAEKDYVATLRAELDEWHNAAKFVADGCTDEIHCGCVPILKREMDAANKAVEEARELLVKTEWTKFDTAVIRHYCWCCDHLMGEHYPECELSAWLTAHPEEE